MYVMNIETPYEYDTGKVLYHQDITAPKAGVDIQVHPISPSGINIHVYMDGICVLRVCKIPYLEVDIANQKPFIIHEPGHKKS